MHGNASCSYVMPPWVLREARKAHRRDRKAIGWNYPC